ncbi:MAG: FAD-dependent oxidoreductase [Clostridia bacterium]|nr:FAD-dependent oxidoreductase [Clostridia bacterium]
MEYYLKPEEKIPVIAAADVLVTGSGPAGIGAALTAARAGADVILIESTGAPGGIATTGLMSHWTGTVDSELYREILQKSAEKNDFTDEVTVTIDPEKLKILYLELLSEAGVHLMLYTTVTGVVMDGNAIKGVITHSKSGAGVIKAKIVIDASGDGDAAAMAGAEYIIGRESDGKMQPATLMFKVGGVDYDRAVFLGSFESTYETEKGELQALAKKHLKAPAGHVLLYKSTLPGVVTCNMTNCIDVDGTTAEGLTKAETVCRMQLEPIVRFLREFVPGYENCYLISSASLIGIRETRHFKGMETITEQDILCARQFDNYVVKGAHFNFDVHSITGAGLDVTGVQHKFSQHNGYTIPYGCLVPEKIDSLLLAGRCISGTHMAHSNFRAMPICLAIGEAAGAAAAISAKEGCQPRNVKAEKIREITKI